MVLIDRDHLLPTLREQCKAERKERAFLLEGAYHLSLIHISEPTRRS